MIRKAIAISIMLVVALIHLFGLGQIFNGPLYILYHSYFADIIVPFGFYFLLVVVDSDQAWLRGWKVKAALVFGLSTLTEIGQAFGLYTLGVTFDPLDIVMFAFGVSIAVAVDRLGKPARPLKSVRVPKRDHRITIEGRDPFFCRDMAREAREAFFRNLQ